jgi:outer membrane protein assembly factor BamB
VWKYTGQDSNGDGELAFEETMHRTLSMVAIRDGLLIIGDFTGLVHCLDVKTGKPHWTYDMLAAIWGSPMLGDGKIYLGNADGEVVVFELSPEMKLLAKNNMGNAVYGSVVAVGDTLYIPTQSHLFAIAQGARGKPK